MKKIMMLALISLVVGCNNTGNQTTTTSEQKKATTDSNTAADKKSPGSVSSSTNGKDGSIMENDSKGPHDNLLNPDDSKTGATAVAGENKPNEGNAGGTVALATGAGFTDNNNPTVTPESGETIVFVGIFAQWKTSAGELFDGSYDTTHHLFVFCATDNCKPVPESEVQFPQFGSCDLALENRLKLFRIQKNGSINPMGSKIKLVGTKGYVQVNGALRPIQFDAPTIKRINKAKMTVKPATPSQAVPPVKMQKVIVEDKNETQKSNLIQPTDKVIMVKPGIDAANRNATSKPAQNIVTPILVKEVASPVITPQKTFEQPVSIDKKLQVAPAKEVSRPVTLQPVVKQQLLVPTKKVDTAKALKRVTVLKKAERT